MGDLGAFNLALSFREDSEFQYNMATRSRDPSIPNGPDFDPRSSMMLSKLNKNNMLPRDNAYSPQNRRENVVGAAQHIENQQSLSSPPSAKGLRARRMLEDLAAENKRLKDEMKTVHSQHAEVTNRMVTDLVKARMELQARDVRLHDQEIAIEKQKMKWEQVRDDISNKSAKLEKAQSEPQNYEELQQTISQLTIELREKDLHLREKDQILREKEFELRAMSGQLEQEQTQRGIDAKEVQQLQNLINERGHTVTTMGDSELETERSRAEALRQQLRELEAAHALALSQIDIGKTTIQQYLDQLSQLRATQDAAESAINTEKRKSEQYSQEIEQRNTLQQEQQSQMVAHEAEIRSLTQELSELRTSFEKTAAETKDITQAQEQIKATHATELAEALRKATFFQKNSEATTRKVKKLEAEVESLKQLLRGNDIREDSMTIAAVQGGWGFSDLPGAWPDADMQHNTTSLPPNPQGRLP